MYSILYAHSSAPAPRHVPLLSISTIHAPTHTHAHALTHVYIHAHIQYKALTQPVSTGEKHHL